MVPGWPDSVVAALGTGRTSWTAVLAAVRLEPGADVASVTTVTTVPIREVVERLVAAGRWKPGDGVSLRLAQLAQDVDERLRRRMRWEPGPRSEA